MIYKAFRFDDMHGVAVIGFANTLPLKGLAVFLPPIVLRAVVFFLTFSR